jgi:uncharacterized protein YcbK (DUF882 family)
VSHRYFTPKELDGLQQALVEKLLYARSLSGTPFVITSGLRTPEQNAAAHGASSSSHVRGWGVDIACTSDVARFLIIRALLAAGFNRIGVYDKHIHADCDPTLPQNVTWVGVSH